MPTWQQAAPQPSSSRSPASSPSLAKEAQSLVPYAFQPPPWRPLLHPALENLGVPDLFPTRSGQAEDEFTQATVRSGFVAKFNVPNETLLAHDIMQDLLQGQDILDRLRFCVQEVLDRRSDLERNCIASSQHKAPSRVTLNDLKLANYVKDLADPEVPLHRLSRSVPHGFKGERMFEMLWTGGALTVQASNPRSHLASRVAASAAAAASPTGSSNAPAKASVEISRAVWFVRAVGAAELQSARNKSSTGYSVELTSSLCSWLHKQIAELSYVASTSQSAQVDTPSLAAAASPTTPSPGYFQPRTRGSGTGAQRPSFQGTRSTPQHPAYKASATIKECCAILQNRSEEERWLSKWSYSISLARHLTSQNLLDRPTLFRWIIEALQKCNWAQVWFLIQLTDEVVQLVVQRRFLALPLVTAVCAKLSQLDQSYQPASISALRTHLDKLLFRVMEQAPETFISPRLWYEHRGTIARAIQSSCSVGPAKREQLEQLSRRIDVRIGKLSATAWLEDVVRGKRATASTGTTSITFADELRAFDTIEVAGLDLQALSPSNQCATDAGKASRSKLASFRPLNDRIDTILTWACTRWRVGSHRPFIAASLIEKLKYGENIYGHHPAFGANDAADESGRGQRRKAKVYVESALMKWLNDVDAAIVSVSRGRPAEGRVEALSSCEPRSVIIVFGELARRGIFSYSRFLQRLIARGTAAQPLAASGRQSNWAATDDNRSTTVPVPAASLPGQNTAQTSFQDSLQRRLLRALPLYEETPAILQQRRMAIYGERAKETYEEANERRALREIRQLLPWLFDEVASPSQPAEPMQLDSFSMGMGPSPDKQAERPQAQAPAANADAIAQSDLQAALRHLWNASRYTRIRLFRSQILPRAATCTPEVLSGERFCLLVSIMTMGEDFESLLQLMVSLLLRRLPFRLAKPIYDLLIEYHEVWRGLDALPTLALLVRQQLNHASSVRDLRLAVLASNVLQRLKESRSSNAGGNARDAPQRACPDVALDLVEAHRCEETFRHFGRDRPGNESALDGAAAALVELRRLFTRSDTSVDETIELAVVKCLTKPGIEHLSDLAVGLLDLLHQEASTEIDERHARWLSSLAVKLSTPDVSPSMFEVPLKVIARLVTLGVASLVVVARNLLLPLISGLVQTLTDPLASGTEAVSLLLHCTSLLSSMLLLDDDPRDAAVRGGTLSEQQSLRAQRMLLFAPNGFDALVRIVTLLQVACLTAPRRMQASSPTSPASTASPFPAAAPVGTLEEDLIPVQSLCQAVLRLDQTKCAFFRDPRTYFRAIRETTMSVWGSDTRKVLDSMVAAMDPSTLLLYDLNAIDMEALRRRSDGWHSAVLTCELVDVFERLQAAEPSFQVRAEAKLKSLATGLFKDLFLNGGSVGRDLLIDAGSTSLAAKFLDEGLRAANRALELEGQSPDGAGVAASKDPGDSGLEPEPASPPSCDSIGSIFAAIKTIVELQDTLVLTASDSDAATQLFQRTVSEVRAAALDQDLRRAQDVLPRLGLIYLLLRLNCLWTSAAKAGVAKLLGSLLSLCQLFGVHDDHEASFDLVLDTYTFVLDEAPPAVLAPLSGDLDWRIESMRCLSVHASSRMQRQLSNLDFVDGSKDLVLTPSLTAAVQRGWFTPEAPKPWDCLEYIEPLASASASARGRAVLSQTGADGSVLATTRGVDPIRSGAGGTDLSATTDVSMPGARAGWPSKLSTHASLPLTLFGGKVTRDTVPCLGTSGGGGDDRTVSATIDDQAGERLEGEPGETATASRGHDLGHSGPHLESERNYGPGQAGEPIFARDLRRGLVPRDTLPPLLAAEADATEPSTHDSNAQDSDSRDSHLRERLRTDVSNEKAPVGPPERITIDLTGEEEEMDATGNGAEGRARADRDASGPAADRFGSNASLTTTAEKRGRKRKEASDGDVRDGAGVGAVRGAGRLRR